MSGMGFGGMDGVLDKENADAYLAHIIRERNQLQEEVMDWRMMAERVAEDKYHINDEKHCSCVGVLRKMCLDLTDRLHTMDQELQLVAKDAIALVHAYNTDNKPPDSIVKRYSSITEWVSRDSRREHKL